jgi:hypothetical protein
MEVCAGPGKEEQDQKRDKDHRFSQKRNGVGFHLHKLKKKKLFSHPRNPSQPPFNKGRRRVSPFGDASAP